MMARETRSDSTCTIARVRRADVAAHPSDVSRKQGEAPIAVDRANDEALAAHADVRGLVGALLVLRSFRL
jgi:hypothetical protein